MIKFIVVKMNESYKCLRSFEYKFVSDGAYLSYIYYRESRCSGSQSA